MKKFKQFSIPTLCAMSIIFSNPILADDIIENICPTTPSFNPSAYLGFDWQMRHMSWARNFGNNLFKKNYPQGNLFLGFKFNDYVGLEVGYQATVTRTRYSRLGAGSTALGIPVGSPPAFFPPVTHRSNSQFKGWNGAINGYLPVYLPDCVYLFGGIGFSHLKLFQRDLIVQDRIDPFAINRFSSTFKKNKTVLALTGGALIKLDEVTAFRLKIGWENTSKFKTLLAREHFNQNGIGRLRTRNSFVYGLGIVINLF